ncbi:CPBP family intramembrane metalloprotease [Myxococcus sp. K15C18031901]|uniref:CPBP family intramembrane glutamic endopeptidase n=1 Tax=Myxococcus dinghuensis TaxID=2906761 RepID=UPI0020A80205|nr:CPBP family intramembrane glutamic endopeptidase [Myxococcus dinghuensis]MCP3103031.1 CPBP family intramembrane metalloprotease [Myxococcus dinghuensis]
MRSVFRDASGGVRNGWKMLGCFVLTVAMVAGAFFVRSLLPVEVRRALPQPHWAFIGTLFASWVCVRLEREPLASLGLKLDGRWGREVSVGTLGGVVLLGLVVGAVWLAGGFSLARTPNAGLGVIGRAAWMMIGVALFEELLFRGYLFQRLIRGVGSWWAQGLMALVFCLAHPFGGEMSALMRTLAMVNTFLAGLMLGLCYVRTTSLALPVGVHLGWNWLMNCLGFGVSGNDLGGMWKPVFNGMPVWLTGGDYGLEASVVCTGGLVLTVLALALWKGPRPRGATTTA